MKTVGQILKEARQTKGISHEKLAELTRIDASYIRAIEEANFKELPSATFSKGFIRNLSKALDKNPDEMVAIFRRDYQQTREVLPQNKPRRISLGPKLFQRQTVLIALGIVVFLIYLGFQYRAVVTPPKIEIESPQNNAIVVSPVNIVGTAEPGAVVVINDDLKVTPDPQGNFAARLNLSSGQNEIKISVTNRFSRSAQKIIPITIFCS